jgi:hypothetical protein
MAVVLGQNVRVDMYIPEADESIVAVFPSYDNADFAKAITTLLKGRFKQIGRKVENRTHEARIKFFDECCIAVEGIEIGSGDTTEPLTPDVDGWLGKIPANWKVSIAATFEEKETLSEDDRGN